MRKRFDRYETMAACEIIASVILFAGACTSSAPQIQTSAQIVSGDSRDTSAYVVYRKITRDDFQAASPPAQSSEHAERIGALLCGAIIPESEIVLNFESDTGDNTGDNDTWFTMRGPDYRAKMDRACSWWNAEQVTTPAEYVLEHEQVHFALIEIYAREINRELGKLRIRVGTSERAPKAADESATRLLERATRDLVEESRRFDHQTSRAVDREAQREWKRDVELRLLD